MDPAAAASKRMGATRSKDNPRELAVRSALHRLGYRYRIHARLIPGSTRTTDIAFVGPRIAVFLDGCFWHGCPLHGTFPKTNGDWWRAKIEANRLRDINTDLRLKELGWKVIRIWEHVPLEQATSVIATALRHAQRSVCPRD